MAFTTGDNNYNTTKWMVNPTAGLGTHTTIATALTSASSGDDIYIMPATYTENLTLKAGVNLIAYNTDSFSGQVIILGKCSASFSGTCNITGIQLKTNGAFALELTGANATQVNLFNCYLNCNDATGISSTGSNSSALVNVYQSLMNLGTTGIAYFAATNGTIGLYNCVGNNSGSSTTANTFSGLALTLKKCFIGNGITTSGSTAVFLSDTNYYSTTNVNVTAITSNSTATPNATISNNDYFGTGSATPVVVGASSLMICTNSTSFSTNATFASGAGTLNYGGLVQSNTEGTITTTAKFGFGTIGKQDSNAIIAGYIGEVISSANTSGNTLSAGKLNNVASITLTAGHWDVSGIVDFIGQGGTNTVTYTAMAISAANNNTTPADNFGSGIGMLQNQIGGAILTTTTNANMFCGPGRLTVAVGATTTYYLNAAVTASALSCKAYGVIRAVRVA